ncbi:uncharacterized protein BO66DRAFT_455409 [Aspergillus aculeatinus CBS 121060]|uniref:Uncharacterized protein n=1 Tax=Aspergillus aculeatinus CBS 121060 TaxID=1448322 RepID=A0ACD1H3X9_9EURO|nr:hypothetical protein BO66DRAFT_455409 [Aspergillus aculeatinus CBS 121060]RAH68321.1 hypothetical protein BO66DRAFT_455409 [Aspergillus aculeatinus CBS 121060]
MGLSAETIIALVALLVACVPGLWFMIKHNASIRRWWNNTQVIGDSILPHPSHTSRTTSFYNLGSSRRSTHGQTILPFFNPFDPILYRSSPSRAGPTPQQSEMTFIFYRAIVDMVPDREQPYAGV